MTCSTCRYYVKTDLQQGECHYGPPTIVIAPGYAPAGFRSQPALMSMFPPTKSDNWCGEHEEKVVIE